MINWIKFYWHLIKKSYRQGYELGEEEYRKKQQQEQQEEDN